MRRPKLPGLKRLGTGRDLKKRNLDEMDERERIRVKGTKMRTPGIRIGDY